MTEAKESKKCPVLPNWIMDKEGRCKRYQQCSPDRHAICGAKPK